MYCLSFKLVSYYPFRIFKLLIYYAWKFFLHIIPVNSPPLRRSLPRKSLISHMDWVSRTGDINLLHDLPPTKNLFTFFSRHLLTIDRLFPSIVEMFRINFYRVPLDFSFRNTKLIVVYVIERITTPIRKRNTIVNSRTSGKNHTTG